MHYYFSSLVLLAITATVRGAAMPVAQQGPENPNSLSSIDTAEADCYWDGTAPFCAGGCPQDYSDCGRSTYGDGAACWTGIKVYCCRGSCPDV
ncbi:hypothetical protein AOQ84DRAFT_372126 [Glonium stellatum]|uniref:Uncharacterized protein n=1 Tax=Glonium stellatum TaxID=574774 RepID=A0A8E2FAC4_9PEZI|nr:hypothetical protein AOQ84DRAFT_372126 [Glonium stellatum]